MVSSDNRRIGYLLDYLALESGYEADPVHQAGSEGSVVTMTSKILDITHDTELRKWVVLLAIVIGILVVIHPVTAYQYTFQEADGSD